MQRDAILVLSKNAVISLRTKLETKCHLQSEGYVPNTAQRRLAEEVTRFVHGEEGLQAAIKATQVGAAVGLFWSSPLIYVCSLFLRMDMGLFWTCLCVQSLSPHGPCAHRPS